MQTRVSGMSSNCRKGTVTFRACRMRDQNVHCTPSCHRHPGPGSKKRPLPSLTMIEQVVDAGMHRHRGWPRCPPSIRIDIHDAVAGGRRPRRPDPCRDARRTGRLQRQCRTRRTPARHQSQHDVPPARAGRSGVEAHPAGFGIKATNRPSSVQHKLPFRSRICTLNSARALPRWANVAMTLSQC